MPPPYPPCYGPKQGAVSRGSANNEAPLLVRWGSTDLHHALVWVPRRAHPGATVAARVTSSTPGPHALHAHHHHVARLLRVSVGAAGAGLLLHARYGARRAVATAEGVHGDRRPGLLLLLLRCLLGLLRCSSGGSLGPKGIEGRGGCRSGGQPEGVRGGGHRRLLRRLCHGRWRRKQVEEILGGIGRLLRLRWRHMGGSWRGRSRLGGGKCPPVIGRLPGLGVVLDGRRGVLGGRLQLPWGPKVGPVLGRSRSGRGRKPRGTEQVLETAGGRDRLLLLLLRLLRLRLLLLLLRLGKRRGRGGAKVRPSAPEGIGSRRRWLAGRRRLRRRAAGQEVRHGSSSGSREGPGAGGRGRRAFCRELVLADTGRGPRGRRGGGGGSRWYLGVLQGTSAQDTASVSRQQQRGRGLLRRAKKGGEVAHLHGLVLEL